MLNSAGQGSSEPVAPRIIIIIISSAALRTSTTHAIGFKTLP
jgi:hypothetical protein